MHRGTTPTFVITLPTTTAVSDITTAFLTFEQNGEVLFEKDITDMTIDTDKNTIEVVLTQEETLSFAPKQLVYYQLRFKIGGSAYATGTWQTPAEEILKDGVI